MENHPGEDAFLSSVTSSINQIWLAAQHQQDPIHNTAPGFTYLTEFRKERKHQSEDKWKNDTKQNEMLLSFPFSAWKIFRASKLR